MRILRKKTKRWKKVFGIKKLVFREQGEAFLKKVIMRRRKKAEAEKKTRLKALSFFLKGGRQRREA